MQVLNAIKNTYTVYKNGEEVGWIRFIRYVDRRMWLIEEVSPGIPVSMAHYNSENAKGQLERNGFTWAPGENKKYYLYK